MDDQQMRQNGCVTNFDHSGGKWTIWRQGDRFTLAPFGVFAQQHQWSYEPLFQSIAAEIHRLACEVGRLRRQVIELERAAARHEGAAPVLRPGSGEIEPYLERHPELLEELENASAPKQVHELKTLPAEFQAVLDGKKRHETRRSDREFRPGESVRLREWDPKLRDAQNPFSGYTGRELTFTIGDVARLAAELAKSDTRCDEILEVLQSRVREAPGQRRLELEAIRQQVEAAVELLAARPVTDWGEYGQGREHEREFFGDSLRAALDEIFGETTPAKAQGPTTGPSFRAEREATADRAAESREPGRVEGVDRG